MVEIGSRVGLSGLNVSQTEFLHEAIDCFSPPIVDKDLIDGNEVRTFFKKVKYKTLYVTPFTFLGIHSSCRSSKRTQV